MRGHAVIGESPVSGFVPRWIEGWLLPGPMLFRKKCCQVTTDVLVSLSTSHSTTVYIAGTSGEKNRHRYSGVPVVGPPGFFFIPPADHREWLVLSAHLALLSWSPLISISGTQVEIRFITAWKNSSDVIKSHRFLFFVKFGVESKLEWSFYDQY